MRIYSHESDFIGDGRMTYQAWPWAILDRKFAIINTMANQLPDTEIIMSRMKD